VNLVADENVDRSVVGRLREERHEVLYTAELEPGLADALFLQRLAIFERLSPGSGN